MACSASVPLVLVTGASGFVASHVIQQLLRSGEFVVRGSVRNVNNEQKIKPLQELCPEAKYPLQLVQADLLDSESWIRCVENENNSVLRSKGYFNRLHQTTASTVYIAGRGKAWM